MDDDLVPSLSKQTFENIGEHILDGLTEEEACIVENIPYETLRIAIEEDPLKENFIKKKKIEFKKRHLQVVNEKKDPKNSIWLLERLMPEQFASKKVQDVAPADVLAVFVKQIQYNGPNLPVKAIENEGDGTSRPVYNIEVKDILR